MATLAVVAAIGAAQFVTVLVCESFDNDANIAHDRTGTVYRIDVHPCHRLAVPVTTNP